MTGLCGGRHRCSSEQELAQQVGEAREVVQDARSRLSSFHDGNHPLLTEEEHVCPFFCVLAALYLLGLVSVSSPLPS